MTRAETLPNFIIIGSMKSGTSSLYRYLRAHRETFMPEPKEPDYFTTEETFRERRSWYEELFVPADGARCIGEASTSYTKYPDVEGVPERIAATLPDVRLIYLIRHPIERIRSQYLHELLMSEQREPIRQALSTHPRFVNYSRYWMQLERFLEHFSREQLLVVRSEEMRADRRSTLGVVCRFLGLDPDGFADNVEEEYHRSEPRRVALPGFKRWHHSAAYRATSRLLPERVKAALRPATTWQVDPEPVGIPEDLRLRLEDAIRPDLRSLQKFLGPGFDGWGLL